MLDLDPIRARREAATAGPWLNTGDSTSAWENSVTAENGGYVVHTGAEGDGGCAEYADAEFIAHSWQDVGDLLAEVERFTTDAEGLRRAATAVRNAIAKDPARLRWLDWVPNHLDQIADRTAPCKHERASFDHMADETRSVYRCDDCGWLHRCEVDPVSGDIVDVDAETGAVVPHT